MPILAIDTAGGGLSLGVYDRDQDRLLARHQQSLRQGQVAALHPALTELLASAWLRLSDIDGVIVTRGPGSFTGLRVGLAAVQGLKAARPALLAQGVDSFSAQVPLDEAGPAWVALDTRRRDLFLCRWRAADAAQGGLSIQVASYEAFAMQRAAEPLPVYGDALPLLHLGPSQEAPPSLTDPLTLARRFNPSLSASALTPLYSRAPQIG